MIPESDTESPIDINDTTQISNTASTEVVRTDGEWRARPRAESQTGPAVPELIETLLQQGRIADALELEETLDSQAVHLDDTSVQRATHRARALLALARRVQAAGGIDHVRTTARAAGQGHDARLRMLAASLAAIDGGVTNALEVFVELAGAPNVEAEIRIEARRAAASLLDGVERGNIQIESLRRELERAS